MVNLQDVLQCLPDGEYINRTIFLKIIRSLDKGIRSANKQFIDTKELLNLPNSIGLLVVFNENLVLFSPEVVLARLSQFMHPSSRPDFYQEYAEKVLTFNKKVKEFDLKLPCIHACALNNYTIREGVVKAFNAIKIDIIDFSYKQYSSFPSRFTLSGIDFNIEDWSGYYVSDIKDWHTSGKVSSTFGIPM
ncbi:MAG: hypothetical protein H0X31_17695 [Nostocaceae cyanobacterium]|nr:hypothetical protein [Nostocaceae cyanobacterium]